jgi:hypothetical protein
VEGKCGGELEKVEVYDRVSRESMPLHPLRIVARTGLLPVKERRGYRSWGTLAPRRKALACDHSPTQVDGEPNTCRGQTLSGVLDSSVSVAAICYVVTFRSVRAANTSKGFKSQEIAARDSESDFVLLLYKGRYHPSWLLVIHHCRELSVFRPAVASPLHIKVERCRQLDG